jgi:dephospho-CoA kinase
MLKVGLTGNYGMGKSSVTGMFKKLGAVTLDSDEIVAELLREEPVVAQIIGLIGVEAMSPDGTLNKKYIAERVFQHVTLRRRLEAVLHPLVFERVDAFIKKHRGRNKVVIIEVPLLFEGGYERQFDRTITVHANQKTILSRLKKEGVSRKDAFARLKTQLDIRSKMQRADYCINNNGTKRESEVQVRKIFRILVGKNGDSVSTDRHRF